MEIKQLKYFAAIAEEGQITSAAHRLHIAQPPLSQSLKALEEELEVKLCERTCSGTNLTEAGKFVLQRSYEIIHLFDSLKDDISFFRGAVEGTLKIGIVSSSASTLIDDNFMAFHEHYPNIKFELQEGNSFQILEYLTKGIIEIGIVRSPFDDSKFNKISTKPSPMVVVGNKQSFPFLSEEKISIDRLKGQQIIINRRYHRLLENICMKKDYHLRYYCLNNDARTTLYWAHAGLGLGIIPKEDSLVQVYPDLVYAELDEPELFTSLCAIWNKNRPISKIADNFICYFNDHE